MINCWRAKTVSLLERLDLAWSLRIQGHGGECRLITKGGKVVPILAFQKFLLSHVITQGGYRLILRLDTKA